MPGMGAIFTASIPGIFDFKVFVATFYAFLTYMSLTLLPHRLQH